MTIIVTGRSFFKKNSDDKFLADTSTAYRFVCTVGLVLAIFTRVSRWHNPECHFS